MTYSQMNNSLKYPLSGDANEMLLLRVGEIKYLESLQKGVVYMHNINYHRNRGNENPDSCVGDSTEGLIIQKYAVPLKTNDSIAKYSRFASDKIARLTISQFEKSPIFCMLSVNFHIDFDEHALFFKLPTELLNDFASGDKSKYGAIVIDRKRFVERCVDALDKTPFDKYDYHFRRVGYSNIPKEKLIASPENKMGNLLAVFIKPERYAHQNEFRLWIGADIDDNDHFELDIGDISDISIIMDIETAKCGLWLNGDFKAVQK